MGPDAGRRGVVVTGAASGIGRAASLRLARDGARLAVLDRDPEGLASVRRELEQAGTTACALAVDVADPAAVREAVSRVADDLGGLDALVHAAGVIVRKDLAATSDAESSSTLAVNLTSAFTLAQAVTPHLIARGGGSIVLLSSTAASRGGVGYPAYAASKGGLLALSRTLANDLAPHGVRVNTISPGAVRTAINRDTLADPAVLDAFTTAIPLGRVGVPHDVAGAIAFLVGPDADYVTGVDLAVDGGLMSRVGGLRVDRP